MEWLFGVQWPVHNIQMKLCLSCKAGYVAAEDVVRYYGRWQPPDESKAAIKHRAEHSHHDFFDIWSSRVRDFKEFGVGHMMYFHFLWWMAALFCGLAMLVAVPNMSINLAGKYFGTGQLELTTLGNFGRVSVSHNNDGGSAYLLAAPGWQLENNVSSTFMADASLPPATTPFNKASAIVAASALDCAAAGIYFIVTLGLIILARQRAEDADTHTVTIHDYSVYVQKLPGDTQAGELVEYFSQWGEVVNVEVVRAYGSLLKLVLLQGKLLQQLQSALAALQRSAQEGPAVPVSLEAACYQVKEQVAAVETDVQAEEAQGDSRRVVGAFVTFKDEAAKLACLKATPQSWIKQLWYLKSKHKFRGRHALSIYEAPEPSDVQYENMEHGGLDRFVRSLLVSVCSYTALALGFFLISLATASQVSLTRSANVNTNDCSSCRFSVAGAFGLATADRELYASCASTGLMPTGVKCSNSENACYRCYCYTAVTSGMLSETSYCSSAVGLLALQYTGQVGVVLAILGINMLLALTSRQLTLFEKHHTRSSEARSLAHKLFLAQFLNSAVSTIIANAHLPFLAKLLNGSALEGIFFSGIFTDLTPNWYKVVGRSLLISQFVAAFLRIFWFIVRWATARYYYLKRHKCLTQEELETSLRGPQFELDHRYGEHLSVIYVSLLLCGAMPIALVSAAFWFVTSYWCDKLELLSLSRRPVTYGSDLSNHVMNLLPYAAVWHVAFALWAFSMFGVGRSRLVTGPFSALVSTICNGLSKLWENASGITADQATQRLLGADAVHLLILLMVVVAVLFLKLTFTMWIQAGRWVLNMAGVIADNEDTQQTGAPEFPVAVRTQLLVGETSYAIQDQPAYAAAFTKMESVEANVHVQVLLKGPAAKRVDGRDGSPSTLQPQLSPRSASALVQDTEQPGIGPPSAAPAAAMYYPGVTAHVPGTSAVAGDYGGYGVPAPALASAGPGQLRQRTHATSQSGSSSRSSSRGGSRGSRRSSNTGGHPASAWDAGFVGTPQQQQPPQDVSRPPVSQGGLAGNTVGSPAVGWGQAPNYPGEAFPPSSGPPAEPLSAAQRYRQARANQVMPIPEEYLVARDN